MENENQNNDAAEEAALDAEIEKSVAAVNAGETLKADAEGQTGATGSSDDSGSEQNGATGPTGETGESGEGDGNSQSAENKGTEFRVPNKGKFESDEAYEKRVELFDLVKRRKAATTPEAKQKLTEDISEAKKELKLLGENSKTYSQNGEGGDKNDSTVDPTVLADQERAKALGLASKEDVKQFVQQERFDAQVKSDLGNFVERHKDQLADSDVREVFFDFVDQNYIWAGKSGKDLTTTLELAYEAMFKPTESITERMIKGAGVQEKVNAMQFPGSTGGNSAGNSFTPEQKQSIAEMKATGMSEEKAIELIS